MMKYFITIILLCVGIAFSADAQTFTQRIQQTKVGEGTVTITQDKSIDDLVNGPVPVQKTQKTKPTNPTNTKPVSEKPKPTKKNVPTTPTASNDTITKDRQTPDTLDLTPKRYVKMTGYRVQVFAGGNKRQDRQRAEAAGRALRSLFPGEEVYVHFYSPRWICRLGNYRTYNEAHEKMLEVRKLGYESATVVKGKILLPQ